MCLRPRRLRRYATDCLSPHVLGDRFAVPVLGDCVHPHVLGGTDEKAVFPINWNFAQPV
jgi:hypothetical protein